MLQQKYGTLLTSDGDNSNKPGRTLFPGGPQSTEEPQMIMEGLVVGHRKHKPALRSTSEVSSSSAEHDPARNSLALKLTAIRKKKNQGEAGIHRNSSKSKNPVSNMLSKTKSLAHSSINVMKILEAVNKNIDQINKLRRMSEYNPELRRILDLVENSKNNPRGLLTAKNSKDAELLSIPGLTFTLESLQENPHLDKKELKDFKHNNQAQLAFMLAQYDSEFKSLLPTIFQKIQSDQD